MNLKKAFIGALAMTFIGATATFAEEELQTMNKKEFKEKVWDPSTKYKFKGDKPIVLDFNAKWCQPCKKVHPILVELQQEYGDKLTIYSVDIDKDKEGKIFKDFPNLFGFDAIPTLVFFKPGNSKKPEAVRIHGNSTKEDLKALIDSACF